MNKNLKKLKIKLIIENNDGRLEKNDGGKAEGGHGANLVWTIFNAKDYIIKDITVRETGQESEYSPVSDYDGGSSSSGGGSSGGGGGGSFGGGGGGGGFR